MANKFFSLLDKIGSGFKIGIEKAIEFESKPGVLAAEVQIATAVSPLIGVAAGPTILELFAIIGKVEQFAVGFNAASGTGAQKLQFALPDIEAAIMKIPVFKGKTPKDLGLWNAGLVGITDGLAKLANAIETTPPTP